MKTAPRSRFTLAELLFASTVTVLLLTSIMPFAVGILKSSLQSSLKADMRNQINIARSWLTYDIEGTSQGRILSYVDANGTTRAFALPIYRRPNATDVPVKTDGVTVNWTDEVAYYLYTDRTGNTSFSRAAFPYSYFSGLSSAGQLSLLADLVSLGSPAAAGVTSANIRYYRRLLTQVNGFTIQFTPSDYLIDGYAAAQVKATVPLGTVLLTPGVHRLKFVVAGRNGASAGFGIGIDNFIGSPTSLPQEAEHYLPVAAYTGPTPAAQNMVTLPNWSNNAILNFPATTVNQSFEFDFTYDTWWESLFNNDTAAVKPTFDKTQVGVLGTGDQVAQMMGNTVSWSASALPTPGGGAPASVIQDWVNVRTIVATPVNNQNGKSIQITFKASDTQGLAISSPTIMQQSSNFDGTGGAQNLYFSGNGYAYIPAGSQLTSDVAVYTLDPTKNYLISYYVLHSSLGANGAYQQKTVSNLTAVTSQASNLTSWASWSAIPGWAAGGWGPSVAVTLYPQIIGVSSLVIWYPDTATYTSQIVDTQVDHVTYQNLLWHATMPNRTGLNVKVRAGVQADLSDAVAWAAASSYAVPAITNAIGELNGRYVQFQAQFTSQSPYTATASLQDVKITWQGNEQLVAFSADIAKGPDRGKFQFLVDGVSPQPTWVRLTFSLNRLGNGQTYTGNLDVELQPRNK